MARMLNKETHLLSINRRRIAYEQQALLCRLKSIMQQIIKKE